MANLLYLLLITSYLNVVRGQSACTTPRNITGTCKSIYECEPLLEMVNNNDRTQQDMALLRNSKCGESGDVPKVCCPNTCRTPDGYQGQCINIYQCAHLVNMLQTTYSTENLKFVEDSKCQGPDQFSVCCRTNIAPIKRASCKASVSAYPPEPNSECCGRDSVMGDRIIGGSDTHIDQYPWLAIIEYIKTGSIKLLCGGVLVSGKYVLTAAHCVTGPILQFGTPKNVRLGEYDTSNDGEDCTTMGGGQDCTEGALIVPIEKTIPHPDYNLYSSSRWNDIGLIKLRDMAPYTDFIRPICLPSVDLTASPPDSFKLYAAGWGAVGTKQFSSRIKQHVDLPFISYDQCQVSYKPLVDLWEKQMCAGGEAGKDSCRGDSGGPLMFKNGKSFEVIGIVSFGPTPCGLRDFPGVYTKVHAYKDWIKSTIEA